MAAFTGRGSSALRFSFLLLLAALFVAPAGAAVRLSTITIAPGTVTGGGTATGTATLTSAAGRNGAVVTLSSSNSSVATVPASITIPSGQTTGTFTINTTPVAAQTGVTVSGSLGTNATASFTVVPPALTSLAVSPGSVTATQTSTGTVVLDGAAPAAGITVALSSTSANAQVPSSVTVAAGQTSATFTIATTQVASQTTATIVASAAGNSRVATLTITPCSMAEAFPPNGGFAATDVIWIDDTLPAGMTLGGASWDTGQKASGGQSLTQPWSTSYHEMVLTGATSTLAVNASETLVFYLLTSNCTPPRELIFGWHTAGGVWKKAYIGTAVIGGESSYVYLGAMPAGGNAGFWGRWEIPVSALQLGSEQLDGFSVQASDGQAWVDRIGKICVMPPAAAPSVPVTDVKWIDDGNESGNYPALPGYGAWDTTQAASGTKSVRLGDPAWGTGGLGSIQLQNVALPANIGDKLVLYALADSCAPPEELSVLVHTTWGEWKSAYWGTPHFNWDVLGTSHGPVPAAGSWARLEVPFSALGIEERIIDQIQVWNYNGRIWVDGIANSGTGCTAPTAAPASAPGSDTVFLEDSGTLGATLYSSWWTTSQHATGSKAFTSPYTGTGSHYAGIEGNYPRMDISFGENIVFYMLFNPCAPPSQFRISWSATGGMTPVYWGTETPGTGMYMGPMPPAGVWHRVEIPMHLLSGYTTQQLSGFFVTWTDGEFWIDRVGKSGTACTTAIAPQPSIPATDVFWYDEYSVPNAYMEAWFENASQAASGTHSFTDRYYGAGNHLATFYGDNVSLPVSAGDKLVTYVLLDPCAPPTEILVRWRTGTTTTGFTYSGAYWGTPHNFGEGTTSFSMGALPPTGVWTRLEIPASQLGLEGQTVTGMDFIWTDGRAWWDAIGRTAQ